VDTCHFVKKYFLLDIIIIIINIILLYIYQISYGTTYIAVYKQSKPSSLAWEKNISFVKLKIIFKITGQSEYGRKLQSMIKMFFQQKIPEKKAARSVHYTENNLCFLPVKKYYTMEERNYLQVIKRWAEILDDRSYKSI